MGQNHDTPNPSITDATQALESALSDLSGAWHLLRALAACENMIEAPALYPVADAVQAVQAKAERAVATLLPILCAAAKAQEGAQ